MGLSSRKNMAFVLSEFLSGVAETEEISDESTWELDSPRELHRSWS
jgi:hypothetical protein